MRNILLATVAVCLCFAIAGCQTTAPGTGPISSGTGVPAKIIKGAQTLCQFQPTQQTVTDVLTAAPVSATIDMIVKSICAAVAPLASGPGSSKTPGYAYGVKIRGKETF